MFDAFRKYIAKHRLCFPEDRILVAVSGGVDSVVMLNLLHRAGYALAVAHCNFQLRGKDADADALFVQNLAKTYQIPFFVKTCDARTYAIKEKISIEMAARRLRYDWFEELQQLHGFQKLAVGHNKDDDAETFFIKLLRGSGLEGLKGMMPLRGKIMRPLLFAPRSEIMAYALKHRLAFREDATNASDDYLRNRIRHKLLPFLEKEYPGARRAVADTLDNLKTTATVFRQLMEEKKTVLLEPTGSGFRISKTHLRQLKPLQAWLYFLLEDFGFRQNRVSELAKAITTKQTGQFFYSDRFVLLNDRDDLLIREKKNRTREEFFIRDLHVSLTAPVALQFETFPRTQQKDFHAPLTVAFLDAEKLKLPLKLRHWQRGDRFVPFGMQGSKLLSDFFTDEKLNRFEREKVWLLLSDEEIVWVVGYRISARFGVTKKTEKVLKITVQLPEQRITD